MSVLSEILADKKTEIYCASKRVSITELEKKVGDLPPTRDFTAALLAAPRPALIAEIKKASPSKGIIREDFDAVEIAKIYAANGAACLSILTDEQHFQGRLSYLADVRKAVELPLLRKDFIIDDYQVVEARVAGADAVLLIAAALTYVQLEWLLEATETLGMAAIVEVHNDDDLDMALSTQARIIGINNRDLHTFRTTLQATLDLAPRIGPDRVVVSESGISRRLDVDRLTAAGVNAVLIGEAFMRERDIAAKMKEILGTTGG